MRVPFLPLTCALSRAALLSRAQTAESRRKKLALEEQAAAAKAEGKKAEGDKAGAKGDGAGDGLEKAEHTEKLVRQMRLASRDVKRNAGGGGGGGAMGQTKMTTDRLISASRADGNLLEAPPLLASQVAPTEAQHSAHVAAALVSVPRPHLTQARATRGGIASTDMQKESDVGLPRPARLALNTAAIAAAAAASGAAAEDDEAAGTAVGGAADAEEKGAATFAVDDAIPVHFPKLEVTPEFADEATAPAQPAASTDDGEDDAPAAQAGAGGSSATPALRASAADDETMNALLDEELSVDSAEVSAQGRRAQNARRRGSKG